MHARVPSMIHAGGGAIVNNTTINEHGPQPLMASAPTKAVRGGRATIIAARVGQRPRQSRLRQARRDQSGISYGDGSLVAPQEVGGAAAFRMSDDAKPFAGSSQMVDTR